ncbi:Na+/H+ antiporter NhaC family protein [Azospirillum argentinense]|uniref:Na+/H+ antiporter NhaC-like C-terminal domain-containing protein n=1 Tax=Azospirillum argentinense TaxID=2970906 RepID=A0A5B0KXB2_9PROT|nr:Na+/H+ antiporter NhaC family protein [Azospirillum argentinense]KAA1056576.1 Na+/H+ antiporter NhaC [Azospirillum argentinense]
MANHASMPAEEKREARRPTLLDALLPMIALIALLALSYLLFGKDASAGPNQVALLFSGIIAAGIAYKNGMPWDGVRQAVVDGIATGLAAIMILLAVGALIGTWALSGTIVAMVYYGLQILSPHYFYATTAIICALVGFSIGSSWTVAGTIGIGLMGVAASMNLSPEITAGAVISGAYFGDKASPLSDTANLATAVTGSGIYEHIRESLFTSVPALLVAILLFGMLGAPGDFDATAMISGIESHFTVSLWAFTPLLLVLGLSIARFPPFITIFFGALAGGLLAVVLEPARVVAFAAAPEMPAAVAMLKGVWMALANGYVAHSGNESLDVILTRGGMSSMMNTVWLIITALSFGATVEHAGLVATVVATCIGANIVTSDQYISIALPGRLFKAEFAKRGLAPVLLSRVVGDSATVTSPLIPWNSCGAYMAAALGVSATGFAMYCFFNILNPLVTILFAVSGLRVWRTTIDAPPGNAPPLQG